MSLALGLRSLVIFIGVYTNWRDTEYTRYQHRFVTNTKINERSLFYSTIKAVSIVRITILKYLVYYILF